MILITYIPAFINVTGQRRRIFLLRYSLQVYTVISFLWPLNVRCCNAEPILQVDPPTNAAIGPSPAQRRAAATSKNPTTCTLPKKGAHTRLPRVGFRS